MSTIPQSHIYSGQYSIRKAHYLKKMKTDKLNTVTLWNQKYIAQIGTLTIETPINKSSAPVLRNTLMRMNSRAMTTSMVKQVSDQNTARILGPLFWLTYSGDMGADNVNILDEKKGWTAASKVLVLQIGGEGVSKALFWHRLCEI